MKPFVVLKITLIQTAKRLVVLSSGAALIIKNILCLDYEKIFKNQVESVYVLRGCDTWNVLYSYIVNHTD